VSDPVPIFIRRYDRDVLMKWNGISRPCSGQRCGKRIGFAQSATGKAIPFAVDRVVAQSEKGIDVYEAHFVDCPNAKAFRKKSGNTEDER